MKIMLVLRNFVARLCEVSDILAKAFKCLRKYYKQGLIWMLNEQVSEFANDHLYSEYFM